MALLILLKQKPILVADHGSLRTRKPETRRARARGPHFALRGLNGVSWSWPRGLVVRYGSEALTSIFHIGAWEGHKNMRYNMHYHLQQFLSHNNNHVDV